MEDRSDVMEDDRPDAVENIIAAVQEKCLREPPGLDGQQRTVPTGVVVADSSGLSFGGACSSFLEAFFFFFFLKSFFFFFLKSFF